jgi:hypothetical protein
MEMTDAETQRRAEDAQTNQLPVIDGELVEDSDPADAALIHSENIKPKTRNQKYETERKADNGQTRYIFLPLIFLTVALLGGLRLSAEDDAFLFLKPALVCLIYATFLLILFFRAGLLMLDGWFSVRFPTLKNVANATVLLALFFASAQIFNSLLPERGLPFWVFAFCFFWTLWNNLFVEFQGKRLLQSLGSIFALAFVAKYLILSRLTAPASASWWRGLLENPTQEAFTWFLDLPRFSAGTGYIQFFAVILYLLGLYLTPATTKK